MYIYHLCARAYAHPTIKGWSWGSSGTRKIDIEHMLERDLLEYVV
jgi:hypothetical protein